MSDESSDAEYDLAPVAPIEHPPVRPPQVLPYQRVAPIQPPRPVETRQAPAPKMAVEDRLYFWLKYAGAIGLMLLGAVLEYFVIYHTMGGMFLHSACFAIIGTGFGMFIFAGPSDSDKRGYHF